MRANRTEYLFSVSARTPPTMTVDSDEEFAVEVRGAFDDEDISAVPTPFTPACMGIAWRDSCFSSHRHGGGEEFFVLDGVFQDEHGDYPVGTYVRNPPTGSHTPGSEPGCTIFVKLWQFDPDDRTQLRTDTSALPFVPVPGVSGVELAPLFENASERVRLERWAPGVFVNLPG